MRFSNLLLIAESRSHGQLVAPSMSIPVVSFPTPCIWTRNSVFILLLDSDSPSPREPHIESISSINTTLGDCSLATVKRFFTIFSLSPCHFDTRSEEDREKKVESASVATALARWDLPVPGGPYSSIPFHGFLFPVKSCGNFTGSITVSCSRLFACSSPAISHHRTFGFSVTIAPSSDFFSFSSSVSLSAVVDCSPAFGFSIVLVLALAPPEPPPDVDVVTSNSPFSSFFIFSARSMV
mmetsp:Transcript_1583/g.3723  ORF Transcript_1583/g.3723 Transcript_1583/m.3723 type:complete len:238 (-) Transcript_1583:259-972(-)